MSERAQLLDGAAVREPFEGVEQMQHPFGRVVMDQSGRQPPVYAELRESPGDFLLEKGPEQQHEHVSARVVVRVQVTDPAPLAIAARIEAASRIAEDGRPVGLGMDVHLALQKEARALQPARGLAQLVAQEQREIPARIANQFPDYASHPLHTSVRAFKSS